MVQLIANCVNLTAVLKLLGADIGLSLDILVDGEGATLANGQVQRKE
jgi:hypothetical protein